jgi:hypothetical protein
MASLDAGGGMAAAAPAVEERKFILLVSSDDAELLPEQRKCPVSAGSVETLCTAIQEKLTLPVRPSHLRDDSCRAYC